jgi:hypothetical protein
MMGKKSIDLGRGPRLTRRPLLALCALGLAPWPRGVRRGAIGELELDFEEFLGEAVPLAHELVEDTSRAGQDRYLHALAALAVCLRDVPVPEMRDTAKDGTFIGENECDAPFTVLHWRMEPGTRIGLHPHIYGNVVTLCLAGEVRIENYEMLGTRDFDTRETFRVRRTHDQVLLARNVNLLNLEHGYVHGFLAGPEGARGLDITTRIRPKRSTPTLVVGAPAGEAARALFEARWKHE